MPENRSVLKAFVKKVIKKTFGPRGEENQKVENWTSTQTYVQNAHTNLDL
jgi:hypothetical protein